MKAALLLSLVAVVALVVEGALVTIVPSLLLPDVGLLVAVGAGLAMPAAPALGAVALVGFASDLLSGAPLGQKVLALLVAFLAVRIANGSLELRRGLPEAVLAGLLSLGVGLFETGLLALAAVPPPEALTLWVGLAVQGGVNALCAPAACAVADLVADAAGERELPGRRGTIFVRGPGFGPGRRL